MQSPAVDCSRLCDTVMHTAINKELSLNIFLDFFLKEKKTHTAPQRVILRHVAS